MKTGIYPNIPNAEYHSGPGISKSGLDLIARSPAHYHHAKTAANDNQPTAAQAIGTAFHCFLLEPAEFTKQYTVAISRSDYPEAIEDRDQLVAMVQELNASRLAQYPNAIHDREQLVDAIQALNANRKAKLITGGTKAEIIDRILTNQPAETYTAEQLEGMKAPDLKGIIEQLNQDRPGLLSTSGKTDELAETLRANGCEITLWSEICEEYQQRTGVAFVGSTSASRHDMAAWLSANGVPVLLWSDVLSSWTEANSDRTILSHEQMDQLVAMRNSVMNHPAAKALLTARPGVAEHSFYWTDPQTGVLCRCRPDWLRDDDIMVDLKTTDDASPEAFAKSIVNWRYDVQDPFYRDGFHAVTGRALKAFVFLAVEKRPPYAVGVYVLDPESVDLGRAQYRADLNRYAECNASNNWPAYGDKIQTINLPAWHAAKKNHLLDDYDAANYNNGRNTGRYGDGF